MNKVIPIKKSDRFPIYLGDPQNQKSKKEQVGIAFVRSGNPAFRLKLYMFPKEDLFLISTEDGGKYRIVSLDAKGRQNGEPKAYWNQVGTGELIGSNIHLHFSLISKPMYIPLAHHDLREGASIEAA